MFVVMFASRSYVVETRRQAQIVEAAEVQRRSDLTPENHKRARLLMLQALRPPVLMHNAAYPDLRIEV